MKLENFKSCRNCGAVFGPLVLICPQCQEISPNNSDCLVEEESVEAPTISELDRFLGKEAEDSDLLPEPFAEPEPVSAVVMNLVKGLIILGTMIGLAILVPK